MISIINMFSNKYILKPTVIVLKDLWVGCTPFVNIHKAEQCSFVLLQLILSEQQKDYPVEMAIRWLFYLQNGLLYTGHMIYLYWIVIQMTISRNSADW